MNDIFGIPFPIYCEQNNLGFLTEPFNTISNIAFIFAAYGIYKLLRKNGIQKVEYKILLTLILLLGFGSFLFHATRNPVSLIFDAVPAALIFSLITYILLSKLLGNKLHAILFLALLVPSRFFISSFALTDVMSSLIRNGINATVFLVIIVSIFKKYGRIAFEGFAVLTIYVLAIIMRTIDLEVCSSFYVGTHFLWHVLNALAIYLAIKFLIKLERI